MSLYKSSHGATRLASLRNVPFVMALMLRAAPVHFPLLLCSRIGVAIAPLLALLVSKRIVDAVAAATSSPVSIDHVLTLVAIEFAIVGGAAYLLRVVAYLDALCSERFTLHVSERIMSHAAHIDQAAYEDPEFYDQLERARVQAVDRYIMIKALGDLLQGSVLCISLLAGAAALSGWYVGILVLMALPIFTIDSLFSFKWYSLRLKQTPERRRLDYLRYVASSRESSKELRLFSFAPAILKQYQKIAHRLYDEVIALQRKKLATEFVVVLGAAGQYVICAIVIVKAARGELSIGTMTFLLGALAGIARGVQDIFVAATSVADQALFLTDLQTFLSRDPILKEVDEPLRLPQRITRGFEFENVSFSYPGTDRRILDRVSFAIRPGESVALVGENGEGKSTIVKLLLRFYDPTEGRITLDGVDIRSYKVADLHTRMGVIFQEFMRYDMTLADNVMLGAGSEEERIQLLHQALVWSQAHEFASKLPEGTEQMLGRRFLGCLDLSGGQWQRIALARAYFRSPDLLVLDEPSAALDARAEREVFEKLAELSMGRMVLLISHRFSTVKSASTILVLRDGSISERGSHVELMTILDGTYRRLYLTQAEQYRD